MAAWSKDVGEYRIEELIGYGGCGEVWRARHRPTGESVALKWLRGGGPERREQQLREAGLLAAVSHPHLGRLREVLLDRGDPVLVLDHYAGGSLATLLARRRRLRPGEVVSVLAPIAAALAYAHDEGLVHADVTPANVLFTAAGRPVITDLGVARVLGEDTELHATPEYVDPLVARGSAPSAASDVFGLAAVAFHALAGIPPWNAAGAEATLAVAADGVLPDLRQLAPDAPAELLETVLRALSVDPELRGTAAEFALDVRHACEPEAVAFEVDAQGRPRPPSRTGPVTQGVRVPRSGGPAHAADPVPPGQGRRRAGRAGRAAVAGVRSAAAVLLVLAALAVAVLLGMRWGDGNGPAPAPAVLAPAQAGATADTDADRYAVPDTSEGWADLLGSLYARRADAFARSAPDALTRVYTGSSAQAAFDRREIQRLTAAGLRVDGFAPEVLGVESAAWRAPTVTLVVQDRFGPYVVVSTSSSSAQRVVTSYAGRDEARVQVQLRLTDAGWRIDSAIRLAESG